jgi:hypothetical protein
LFDRGIGAGVHGVPMAMKLSTRVCVWCDKPCAYYKGHLGGGQCPWPRRLTTCPADRGSSDCKGRVCGVHSLGHSNSCLCRPHEQEVRNVPLPLGVLLLSHREILVCKRHLLVGSKRARHRERVSKPQACPGSKVPTLARSRPAVATRTNTDTVTRSAQHSAEQKQGRVRTRVRSQAPRNKCKRHAPSSRVNESARGRTGDQRNNPRAQAVGYRLQECRVPHDANANARSKVTHW